MEPSRIRAVDLQHRLDDGEDIVLIDTRNEKDWQKSAGKLPGALRIPTDQIEVHTHKLPRDRLIVTYCS